MRSADQKKSAAEKELAYSEIQIEEKSDSVFAFKEKKLYVIFLLSSVEYFIDILKGRFFFQWSHQFPNRTKKKL